MTSGPSRLLSQNSAGAGACTSWPSAFQKALQVHVGPARVTWARYTSDWPLAVSALIATFPEPLLSTPLAGEGGPVPSLASNNSVRELAPTSTVGRPFHLIFLKPWRVFPR
jgi:hypothetical protein